jgi:hypothetical protein
MVLFLLPQKKIVTAFSTILCLHAFFFLTQQAAKNPISQLVDAVLDNRMAGGHMAGPHMGGG